MTGVPHIAVYLPIVLMTKVTIATKVLETADNKVYGLTGKSTEGSILSSG